MKNHTKHVMAIGISLMVLLAFAAAPLSAQQFPAQDPPEQDFSDAEIEAFAAALVEIETIQSSMQQELNDIIENGSMDSERFYELHSHFTQTQGTLPEDISSSEEAEFQETFQALVAAEETTQTQMIDAVESEGLDVETFNSIVAVAQQNPELWEEIQSHQQ
ncbi:DUF4168 domain-containing protein [Spirochaeta africana]|uniref:DUF4168 domain-containing protein n=1 Tax=Spirochaeta africana (strain ATCC 700263 / DSM 8902 / Z-7692) TaxID=889378 RepID=H9UFZ0_SPIAZ|nr:DUF4168 domain-containing protein [Spirochaeta africana]AFG36433.1 hypothetical protein Spiaf_0326 [Spirochaeta africana DSM 8902]